MKTKKPQTVVVIINGVPVRVLKSQVEFAKNAASEIIRQDWGKNQLAE